MHQFCRASGGSGNVFDPTGAALYYYEPDGMGNAIPWKKPAYNWPWPLYWQNPPYGLVLSPNPSTPVLFSPPGTYAPFVH